MRYCVLLGEIFFFITMKMAMQINSAKVIENRIKIERPWAIPGDTCIWLIKRKLKASSLTPRPEGMKMIMKPINQATQ